MLIEIYPVGSIIQGFEKVGLASENNWVDSAAFGIVQFMFSLGAFIIQS